MNCRRATARTLAVALIGMALTALPMIALSPAASAAGPNLALGKSMSSSGYTQTYAPSNANDGNQATYWESVDNAFPQWLDVDLGSSTAVNQIVLQVPSGWGARTQTLSVLGSTDNSNFSTIVSSAGYSFDGGANTVTINFGQATARYLRLNVTANNGWPAAQISEFQVYGPATGGGANLALNRATSDSGHTQNYVSSNTTDGNQSTYWESADNAFPQWLQVDLGSSVSVNRIVLKLPTGTWGARTETLSVLGSADNVNFTTIVASAGYTFDGSSNVVTINFSATTTRYVRLNFTGNTGWPAGQVSEFEVYGPTTGDTTPPSAPSNLAYTQPQSGQIELTWSASTDNVGVTAYDIYLNNQLLTSVPGTATSYLDHEADTLTATYFVRARDAAGNQSANSNSVTRTGQTGDTTAPSAPGNLTVTTPQSGTVELTWSASTDNVGVTGYDVYRNGSYDASVGGSTPTYSESQPDSATLMYYVVAKDAAGNTSQPSNTVTRQGSGGTQTNLALGKPVTGTAYTYIFAPANVTDGDLTTYFEGSSYPSQVTVALGANALLSSVTIALNPDPIWATRTQTIQLLGQPQTGGSFTTIAAAQTYTFNPSTNGNAVSIPVSGTYANVEASITSNSGAPGGQIAELEVFGTPAPNPDLTITTSSWTPTSPIETDAITLAATVKNIGSAASPATSVNFYLGSTKVGSATVNALNAGASQTVTANIGNQTAGTYQYTAKVDESNAIIELDESNNSLTNSTSLVVAPVQSADLVGATSWTPSNPAGGQSVGITTQLKNQGNISTSSGSHGVTVTVKNSGGATVATLTGSYSGTLSAGQAVNVNVGSWTAVNGNYTVTTVVAADPAELSIKQGNNTSTASLFVGLGANMPYDNYEAESGTYGGGAILDGPNRTIGDLGGEASGREAVSLNSTGAYVQWTSRESTNTFVVRFSIPDSSGGGGQTATLDLYANGTLVQPLSLTSHFAWLYGAETGPGNSPSAGSPRHIYDEASFLLSSSYPQGTVFKLQKDSSNTSQYAIDFMQLEQATPIANPDPAHYVVPTGFDQNSVQAALDEARMDTTGTWTGVYLPAGIYSVTQKFNVYGKGITITGAGVWYTQFVVPASQEDTDAGWSLQSGASGTTFSNFAWFGNYDQRIDGPGHTWDIRDLSNITLDSIWVEHEVVGVWGSAGVTNSHFTNMRIRDLYADGINLTNHSTGNVISNDEARSTGDDSFALFSAQDQEAGQDENNTITNVTSLLPWRAAGVAVYGGDNNTISNFYVADTLCYSGLTISSLSFGYSFQGFGTTPTNISNFSLVRDGGHFWGGQVFPAIWVFSGDRTFQGIRVSNASISSPTYAGIMFQTDYTSGGGPLSSITDTVFTNMTITGAHQSGDTFNAKSGYGIWANPSAESGQGPAVGSATFNGLTESDNYMNIYNPTTTFTITVN